MPDENSTPKGPCTNERHRQHLCKLTNEFFHLYHAGEYKAMVEKPKFKCIFCGRTANSDKNICYPEEL